MSLVGAFLRCKGTGGSGPVCILKHSLTLPYALYTSIDFGALAKYTTHCARMTWKEGESVKWFVLSSNVCYPDVLRSVTRPRPSFVCWPPTADGYEYYFTTIQSFVTLATRKEELLHNWIYDCLSSKESEQNKITWNTTAGAQWDFENSFYF